MFHDVILSIHIVFMRCPLMYYGMFHDILWDVPGCITRCSTKWFISILRCSGYIFCYLSRIHVIFLLYYVVFSIVLLLLSSHVFCLSSTNFSFYFSDLFVLVFCIPQHLQFIPPYCCYFTLVIYFNYFKFLMSMSIFFPILYEIHLIRVEYIDCSILCIRMSTQYLYDVLFYFSLLVIFSFLLFLYSLHFV